MDTPSDTAVTSVGHYPGTIAVSSVEAAMAIPMDGGNIFLCIKTLEFTLNLLRRENGFIVRSIFFNFIVEILGRMEVLDLVGASRPRAKKIREQLEKTSDAPQTALMEFWNDPLTHTPLKSALLAALEEKLSQLHRQAPATMDRDIVYIRLRELADLFSLNQYESDLLLLAYMQYSELWTWSYINIPKIHYHKLYGKIKLMSQALGVPLAIGEKHLMNSCRLRALGCLDDDLDFNRDMAPFLTGLTDEPLESRYFVRHTEPALPWAMHGKQAEKHGDLLVKLIQRHDAAHGLNILLYGEPGTGKTSFAVSLAAELGMDLYRIRVPDEYADDAKGSRFAALRICNSRVNQSRSMILIDEADDMLSDESGFISMIQSRRQAGSGKKETFNSLLDELKTPCIWITNASPKAVHPSSLRRFDYSICFKPLSHQQRCQVWKNLIGRYPMQTVLDDNAIDRLAQHFRVSAGGVDLALRNCARLQSDTSSASSTADAVSVLERLLTTHCELMDIDTDNNTLHVAGDYSLAGLNVRSPVSSQRVLQAVRQFRIRQAKHRDYNGRSDPHAPRLSLLLSGPPGTGKTEFVKYLSRELDCPLRMCLAGDFLNKYVGETEHNIRHIFASAQADQAILFIDEADGILRSRQFAVRSWEVTQVNEMLSAMENFNGLLVCATNFVEMLDQATLRRFTFKLEFDYLETKGKLIFYEKMFAGFSKQPLDEKGQRRLTGIANLAPGDFHTVRQAMNYLGNVDSPDFAHDDLLSALEQESRCKCHGRSGNFGFGRN